MSGDVEEPPLPIPADYYRRHAARIWQLVNDATTPAVKEHLREAARAYERLAQRVLPDPKEARGSAGEE